MDFEAKVKKLEEIVQKMQTGELSLDKSFELFEQGIKLSKECNKQLSEVENKVKILIDVDKNNNLKTEEYKQS